MTGAQPRRDRVAVRRFDARYTVGRGHRDPQALRRKLDRAAEAWMPELLASALGPTAAKAPDEVWCIRRVQVDLVLDGSEPERTLADRWSRCIASAVAAAMRVEGPDVVRFADRSAQLARFAVDVAAGRAFTCWYHRRFEGLQALGTSAALRTALLEVPEDGVRALASLGPAERRRVIDAMEPLAADAVARGFAEAAGAGASVEVAVEAVALALERQHVTAIASTDEGRTAPTST